MKNWLGAGLLLALAITTVPCGAVEVPGLYEARVPVVGQGRTERNAAIQKAFIEVLVRISGRGAIGTVPGLAERIPQANRYVQQYRYRAITPAPKAPPGATEPVPDHILWVRFDKKGVNRLLRQFGLPVWGATRPATLAWVVVDEQGRRQILSNDMQHPVRELIDERARRRGLPLQLPLYDLQDRAAVRVSDVWGNFEDAILQGSTRYQTEAVLVGRVYRGFGGVWNARWTLYSGGQRQDWELRSLELAEVVLPGVDQTAETLAARFAQVNHDRASNDITIAVSGVRTLADYRRVATYLEKLADVEKVQPALLEAERATFQLRVRSGRLAVAQAISLGDVLTTEIMAAGPAPGTPAGGPGAAPANPAGGPVTDPDPRRVAIVPDLSYRLIP
ncbi:MAG TPA: DUF2066 domain-containing protein [Gammaproteobacteria bacterium]|nr:DUF2066 domain-containing protein [Gammaproteobacteria bacterium]